MYDSLFQSISLLFSQSVVQVAAFLPTILAALTILIVGTLVAKTIRQVVIKVFESLQLSKAVAKTPIEHFLQNAEVGTKIEVVIGGIAYWLVMLIVLQSVVSILGLYSLSLLLERVLEYIPRIVSAVLVLFIGILLAGLVEVVLKGSLRTVAARSSRLLGKVASYLVVTIAVMAAVSELGIANEFILILFVGLVTALALGIGLAVGLGGKNLVDRLLTEWHAQLKKEISEE